MNPFAKFFFFIILTFSFIQNPIFSEKLLLISDAPYVLDNKKWKNFFQNKSWKNDEILEADKDHIFIYLNSYRIPKGMEWKKPSWGLWNIQKNTFLPLPKIPSNLVPIRKVGDVIFLRNKNNTGYYYLDETKSDKVELIKSSIKIRGWFPRADGSVAFILEGEDCEKITGPRQGKLWSVCLLSSDFAEVENIISIDPLINPMLTGKSDNYIVYWQKNLEEKLWYLESVNLDDGNIKILTKSNREDINKQTPPKWLSWIEKNWVVYERTKQITDEKSPEKESPNRSFIAHNLRTDQKKEILLERKGRILVEPSNRGRRKYQYRPYLVIMDYSGDTNPIKVIDIEELKIVFETIFPLEDTLSEKYEQAVFYP